MMVSSLQSRDIVLTPAPSDPVELVRGAVERMVRLPTARA
jgi:hypothetical protein